MLRFFLSFLCWIIISASSFAQANKKYKSLAELFQQWQVQYQVDFSYANVEVDHLLIKAYPNFDTLEENLAYLSKKLPFTYQVLPNNIVAVVPKKEYQWTCIRVFNFDQQTPILSPVAVGSSLLIKATSKNELYIPLETSSSSSFILQADGYENYSLDTSQLKEEGCTSVFLYEVSEKLNEVIITNYLTKGIDKLKTGQIRFNPTYFGLLPGMIEPDVLQSIQALPGVMSAEESVAYLNIRGGTHDQNLFLWDGIKIYQTSHFFGMITSLNPYMTQSTEIIKNGTNPSFGDGVSSVIDMKTNSKVNQTLSAEAGINMVYADFFVDAPLFQNSSLQVSGRHSINQWGKTPTYNRFFDKVFQNTAVSTPTNSNQRTQEDDFSFYDFSFRWLYQVSENDYIRLNGLVAYNDFNLDRTEMEDDLVIARNSMLNQQNLALGAYYERRWNDAMVSNLQFYTSNYQLSAANTNELTSQTLQQENQVEEWGFKWNNEFQLNEELLLFVGYQFNETGILNFENINNPLFTRSVQEALISNSLFSGLRFQPSLQTNVQLGSRINHISKFNTVLFEPRINITHRFLKKHILEFQAEKKSQITTQVVDQQSDFLGVENRRWVLANPGEIPILSSEQLSLGYSFQHKKWLITSDFFYKRILNITSQSQGFQNQFQFERTHGNYEVFGAEFLLTKKWENFSTWLSYSLTDNTYFFEDFTPSQFPNNIDITHVLDVGVNYEYRGVNVASGIHWHSGIPTTAIQLQGSGDDQSFVFGMPNQETLRNFFRIDFSANYTFSLRNKMQLYTGISIWNLLGRTNLYSTFYQNPNHSSMSPTFQRGLDFTPNFSLRLKF